MVFVFLADGFEEIEALTPVDVLRRAGVKVATVGVTGKTVTGSHRIAVTADLTAEEAKELLEKETPEMIVLPGGMPGADNLNSSETVDAFIRKCAAENAYIAAICAAPYVLGVRGILKGRMATCFPGFEDRLEGAEYYDCDVIRDHNMITGRAMGAATEFALELVAALCGDDASEEMKGKILA
jgi:4-methyl-5(b-hydroxyethyl)-thiazole monophosphate biosynthesis